MKERGMSWKLLAVTILAILVIVFGAVYFFIRFQIQFSPSNCDSNYVPAPRIAETGRVQMGRPVLFDASDSIDNSKVHAYTWDFGDGTRAEGSSTSHIYSQKGLYKITLTAMDECGLSTQEQILIEVNPPQEGNGRPARIRPFLAFSYGSGQVMQSAEKLKFFDILLANYAAAPVSPPNPDGIFDNYNQYRREALQRNPNIFMGIYFSAITSHNPLTPIEYSYPSYDFVDGNSQNRNSDNFACLIQAQTYPDRYEPRSDAYAFVQLLRRNPPLTQFQPMLRSQRTTWTESPGHYYRWPFYYFQQQGWILPQTTYLCRPVIAIGNPEVRSFVLETIFDALDPNPTSNPNPGKFPYSNAASFDNAAMFRNQYDFWPGKNQPLSPYSTQSPDADFADYLSFIRTDLHNHNPPMRLMANGDIDLLAGHVDLILTEGGPLRADHSSLEQRLYHYVNAMREGSAIVHRIPVNSWATNDKELNYFIAASMLVYQEGKLGADFGIDALDQTTTPQFQFFPFLYIPSWLEDPIPATNTQNIPFDEPIDNVYLRYFQNGIVVVNNNPYRIRFTPQQYASLNLAQYRVPEAINSLQGIVIVKNCNDAIVDPAYQSACQTIYETAPSQEPISGDMNCDDRVDRNDLNVLLVAINNPTQYRSSYLACEISAGDFNHDGTINYLGDYIALYTQLFGHAPRTGGDCNCDGFVDNFDINPFVQSIVQLGSGNVGNSCPAACGDANEDNRVDNFDINSFVNLLLS